VTKPPEPFGRLFKIMHLNGRFLMIPNRVAKGKAVWCHEMSAASCYASTDAFGIVHRMRIDGYPVVVTNYDGSCVLTPLLQSHMTRLDRDDVRC
jgi:hypothetical protein